LAAASLSAVRSPSRCSSPRPRRPRPSGPLILRGILNLVSFFLLEAIVALIITTLMIKLVDKLVSNFKVDGWWPALVIAIANAVALALVGWARGGDDYAYLQNQPKIEQQFVQQVQAPADHNVVYLA